MDGNSQASHRHLVLPCIPLFFTSKLALLSFIHWIAHSAGLKLITSQLAILNNFQSGAPPFFFLIFFPLKLNLWAFIPMQALHWSHHILWPQYFWQPTETKTTMEKFTQMDECTHCIYEPTMCGVNNVNNVVKISSKPRQTLVRIFLKFFVFLKHQKLKNIVGGGQVPHFVAK